MMLCSPGLLRFNPTLVRLRRVSVQSHTSLSPGFQSHAGSIGALLIPQRAVGSCSFQSHAGSIEAILVLSWFVILNWFQSHAGSIEASKTSVFRDAGP